MLDRRCHEQRDGDRREQQRDEVDIALEVVDLAEAGRNGATSRNAASTCTPGSTTRSS